MMGGCNQIPHSATSSTTPTTLRGSLNPGGVSWKVRAIRIRVPSGSLPSARNVRTNSRFTTATGSAPATSFPVRPRPLVREIPRVWKKFGATMRS